MKEIENDIIKKYVYGDYYIYIEETVDSYECYLKHKDYCVMYMVYGVTKDSSTLEDLLEIEADNIDNDIKFYKEEFEDKD